MRLPHPRGPISAWVILALRGDPHEDPPVVQSHDPLRDLDLELALWLLYQVHYTGFEDSEDDQEWAPHLLAFRRRLEQPFEQAIRGLAAPLLPVRIEPGQFLDQLTAVIEAAPGPELARYLQRDAELAQFLDFMRRRSLYHLRESDPQSFLLPRVSGPAKVALAELQYDEYGAGRPERLHQRLFAEALRGCGLEEEYGHYLEHADAATLAVNNLISLLTLHRRLRGAALGHLAAFEATSSLPCRRIVAGIRRLGLPEATAAYFEEHIEADAAHEQVALRDVCGEAVASDPGLAADMLLGAAACVTLDALSATRILGDWGVGEHSPRGAA